ncbi:Membrane-associated guanylate kinase, WW and PDZ domain-containing protein 3 [Triplophysa tibetana]|uniref:Membrane-associated guanylate kinase, WW and PDZ domain-containing protein 3 n=1 Tax=Triplophysa tibetana TaxID=1572043 RepID=A0A5A9NW04_9TELE|nr:Membrane-associated guanylate kinase, WW and PDZ domain-containing protein 3 [Triplophysa tibetana]
MSKVAVKKLHWRSKVQETFIPLVGSSGELGVAIGGGADYGEFPFVTAAPGGGITVGDIIIEIGGTSVLGLTLGDVRGVLNSCPHPIRIKTVSPGSTLCKDLRLYLSKCFTPGSVDSQLQQIIRENLYLRAVPCERPSGSGLHRVSATSLIRNALQRPPPARGEENGGYRYGLVLGGERMERAD